MKHFTLLFLLLLFSLPLSLSASEKESIYNAYIYNNMESWKRVIDRMHAIKEKNTEQELELLNFEYGYIGWCIGNKKNSLAKTYMKRMEERMNRLKSRQVRPALMLAYESAYLGYQVGLNKFKAPFLGQKSISAAEKSVKQDPDNAFGYVQFGNIDFFRPALFGGSKPNALKHYLTAERLYLSQKGSSAEIKDWNLLALWIQIAQTYDALDDVKRADEYYKKILMAEPNFKWVKDELYSKFKQKHNIS